MRQTQIQSDNGGGILIIGLAMALLFLIVGGFLWAVRKPKLLPNNVQVECTIIQPYAYYQDGWKILDSADKFNLIQSIGQGKAEQKVAEGNIECTRYEDNTTPVTSHYSLMMWREKK